MLSSSRMGRALPGGSTSARHHATSTNPRKAGECTGSQRRYWAVPVQGPCTAWRRRCWCWHYTDGGGEPRQEAREVDAYMPCCRHRLISGARALLLLLCGVLVRGCEDGRRCWIGLVGWIRG